MIITHLASKLNNPKASAKTYWSIPKLFSGKKYLSFLLYDTVIH